VDLSLERVEAARAEIPRVFLDTPQFHAEALSAAIGREVVVKVETVNPIGSFKGRGAWVLAQTLDPDRTWVCSTAGNFGQGLAYAARERGARLEVFAAEGTPAAKVERMRALGAHVEVAAQAPAAARDHAAAAPERLLVTDGLDPAIAEGAGTIGGELASAGPLDTAVVQLGDGALISGVAFRLKAARPDVRVVGVCASGAPAMARSYAARRPLTVEGEGTIATALTVTQPVPESLARVLELVDDVLEVDDDDLRAAVDLVAETLGILVEPAGAAGVAALRRHGAAIPGERVAVLLTGAGTPAAS
jgi:threonine dehydratase